jgi:hypothetical protein
MPGVWVGSKVAVFAGVAELNGATVIVDVSIGGLAIDGPLQDDKEAHKNRMMKNDWRDFVFMGIYTLIHESSSKDYF